MFQGESSLDPLNDLIYFHPRNKVSSEVPDDDCHIYSNNLISLFLHKFRNIRPEDIKHNSVKDCKWKKITGER